MPRTAEDIRSLCRAFTNETVQIMAGIARAKETPAGVRVAAIAHLWDRGWGRPPQTHTGEDGEGDIRVIVRHIVSGRDVLDASPVTIVPQLTDRGGTDD